MQTPNPNFLIFHVDSPKESGKFYSSLLGQEPVESSPTFVLFALSSGLMLGLWSRHTVEPVAAPSVGGAELALTVENPSDVDEVFNAWKAQGLKFLQEPTTMDFGRSFVAVDPDGHRLRVFALIED